MKDLGSKAVRGDFADGNIDYEEGFHIHKHTSSPAVLTENLFFTNETDLSFLDSKEGKQSIVDLPAWQGLKYGCLYI